MWIDISTGRQVWRVRFEVRSMRGRQTTEQRRWKDDDSERGRRGAVSAGWRSVSGETEEINRKLVEILGVDAKQFMQIAMINAGIFCKLLAGKSLMNEKKFSPGSLIQESSGQVQEELKNRNKQCYSELEDNRKSCLQEIEQLEVSVHGSGKGGTAPRQDRKEPDLEAVLAFTRAHAEEDKLQYEQERKEMKKTTAMEKLNQRYSVEKEREFFSNL